MGKIIRLDPHLANMIAAGEVVERAASVVKELLENALDAGARTIRVLLTEAGFTRIRVEDDGSGMDAADAALAFERHATSKIATARDLFRIVSLGFRGEALPSIAAVAHVELVTSTDGIAGRRVVRQAGAVVADELAPAAKGTVVTVTKLFHNTPARLKFLRAPETELARIAELCDRYALIRPDVSFLLENDGRRLLFTTGSGNPEEALAAVYGVAAAKAARPFAIHGRDYAVSGLLVNPVLSRAARSVVTVAVNGRIIQSPKLVQAVVDGCGQTLPPGRFPVATLLIRCDPSLVDVNVHPTKLEVRFSEERGLFGLVTEAVRSAFAGIRLVPAAERRETPATLQTELPLAFRAEAIAEPIRSYEAGGTGLSADYVGQLAGTYLLFQNAGGLRLVDQHAAAERVRYERYRQEMANPVPATVAPLLPLCIELPAETGEIVRVRLADLAALGVVLEPTGDRRFDLVRLPVWFPRGQENEYVLAMVDRLVEERALTREDARDELAKTLACKRSIKANQPLSAAAVGALMADLARCEHPDTCPHGRPIAVDVTLTEIEKWFRRIP